MDTKINGSKFEVKYLLNSKLLPVIFIKLQREKY